jgi:signal transduction histidine kinase
MPEQVWYRSLYWRIGLGFIACVAGLLIAQAVLFLWLTLPSAGSLPGGSPQRLAAFVASDISNALESDPALDLERYVQEQFGRLNRPIVVVMRDGRVIRTRRYEPSPALIRAARARLERETSGRERYRDRAIFGRVVVGGQLVGVVVAPPDGPPWLGTLREHGPTLAIIGIVLLLAGTSAMAFFIFRPAQRRLQDLQRAAAAIGAGDTSARAAERGGDEVAALAHAFNQMAGDLEARVRELRESDRARRQLLADVSHELMTPLTAMRGYLETLAIPQAVRNQADRDRYLQIVMDETLRLESIIGDLLELARLEGGGVTLQREAVPVEWLFSRAADRHGAALREKAIQLDTSIAPGAETVDGDARRLEQALQNLVANAVRHTPYGGRISLSAGPTTPDQHTSRVRIAVRDTGPGIAPEHLPLIFDRFYKADAAREHHSAGSGLGLSIVKAIVERHSGTITASTAPEGGAMFEIILDAAEAQARVGAKTADARPRVAS